MPTPPDAQARAAATYDAAADHFDHEANSFWDRFGRRTLQHAGVGPGARVLDACCGSGASAIPAAQAVGRTGSVLGVDLSERLLERARTKAAAAGSHHATFRRADVLDLGLPAASFDVVLCVFGIFFVPDMQAAVRELWRLVAPGGRLAITTWGQQTFEPLNSIFWDAVGEVRPELRQAFAPWDRIVRPEALRELHESAGVAAPGIIAEPGTHPVPSPENAWTLVLGSGYRGTLEQLDAATRERLREVVLTRWRATGAREVRADVLYAVARKR
jgi:ubiquinone/menaquinone biosynthesis C-methylase UbiE